MNLKKLAPIAAALTCAVLLSPGGLVSQEPPPGADPTPKHDPVVGCIVAGQFPMLQSCISLSSAPTLAQCRAYFRAKEAPSWFYVLSKRSENTTDLACFQSTLPKPKKTLKFMEFYFQCLSKSGGDNRTEDFTARVVEKKGECDKDKLLAAPISNTGPAGVFGSGPGFALGAGNILPIAGGVAGAAAAGTAIVAASGDDGPNNGTNNSTTTTTVTTTSTTTTTTVTTTTTTTSLPTQENRPPEISCSASPTEGEPPLTVNFRLCGSRDPDGDPLRFEYDFGDGPGGTAESCAESHTYTGAGIFNAQACVSDRRPDHKRCCNFRIVAERNPPPAPCETVPPTVAITSPGSTEGSCQSNPITLRATASDNVGVTSVSFYVTTTMSGPFARKASMPPTLLFTDTTAPYEYVWSMPATCDDHVVTAEAVDACGNKTTSAPSISFFNCSSCGDVAAGAKKAPAKDSASSATTLRWASQLQVAGAAGRVSLNGGMLAAGQGRQEGVAQAAARENRIDAELVQAGSAAGLWRFELGSGVAPGSVRVLSGEAIEVSDAAVVFRMAGTVGERVSFVFRTPD